MYYRKIFYYSFAFISLFCISCSKPHTDNSNMGSLNGEWIWISTDGGIANNIHQTPANTGRTITLMLTDDKKYFIYTNNQITSQGNYTLQKAKCIHDQRDKTIIDFSGNKDEDVMVEKIDAYTLTLSDEHYDGVTSVYSRKLPLEW